MSATIQIGPFEATIDGWEWTCEDDTLQRLLNTMLDPYGPSGADPNPDLTAAQEAVERLGGKIIRYDPTEYDPGVVY